MIVLFYRYFHQETSCESALFTSSLWENERLQYLFSDLLTNFYLLITVFQN